ncbi:MAG: hypothetical protein OXC14_13870 [Rhodospirillaceae bacterium]|nr:hypothetical protein [Rhodospirillaceae bacterium]
MMNSLESQLLAALRSDPSREWLATDLHQKLGWDKYSPSGYSRHNQLVTCVAKKLEIDDQLVRVSREGGSGKGRFTVKLN